MATLFASSPRLILRRFVVPFLPTCPYRQPKQCLPLRTKPYLSFSRTLSFLPNPRAISQRIEDDVSVLDIEETHSEIEKSSSADASEGLERILSSKIEPPSLSVKEKKELASYAHSLGKKLKSQQVGKSGVTDTVVTALIETLEANELLKVDQSVPARRITENMRTVQTAPHTPPRLKIHGTCPGELDDVLKQLELSTGSVIVGQIGRTVILYRPSIAKLKAEEKKKQVQRVYLKRQSMSKQSPRSERLRPKTGPGQEQRKFGGGRRGSSRF